MEITTDFVLKLAGLTRLEMSGAEAEAYRQDLAAIISYFQILNAIDTTQISPTARIFKDNAQLGEDVPAPSFSAEELAQMTGEGYDVEQRVFVLQGVLPAVR